MIWSLPWQSRLRWFFYGLGGLAIIIYLGRAVDFRSDLLNHERAKILLTGFPHLFSNLPTIDLVIGATCHLLGAILGVPTIFLILPTFLFFGPWWALACGIFLHFAAMLCSLRSMPNTSSIPEAVQKALLAEEVGWFGLAFRLRLFPGIPPRSADQMLRYKAGPTAAVLSLAWMNLPGTVVRVGLATAWLTLGSHVIVDFRPFPEHDLGRFLFLTSILICLSILPKIPEFLFASGPEKTILTYLGGDPDPVSATAEPNPPAEGKTPTPDLSPNRAVTNGAPRDIRGAGF